MKEVNYSDREPDIDSINEARLISQLTRIQDEKEAAEAGMTIEEYYRERDDMINGTDYLQGGVY